MRDLRTLSHVPRWGVLRVINRQTVADHSYYVTVYCSLLASAMRLSEKETVSLLTVALWHDSAECFTSDIPGPIKKALMNENTMADYENQGMHSRFGFGRFFPDDKTKTILKLADLLDEFCYLSNEEMMGNTFAEPVLNLVYDRITDCLKNPLFDVNAIATANLIMNEAHKNTLNLPTPR